MRFFFILFIFFYLRSLFVLGADPKVPVCQEGDLYEKPDMKSGTLLQVKPGDLVEVLAGEDGLYRLESGGEDECVNREYPRKYMAQKVYVREKDVFFRVRSGKTEGYLPSQVLALDWKSDDFDRDRKEELLLFCAVPGKGLSLRFIKDNAEATVYETGLFPDEEAQGFLSGVQLSTEIQERKDFGVPLTEVSFSNTYGCGCGGATVHVVLMNGLEKTLSVELSNDAACDPGYYVKSSIVYPSDPGGKSGRLTAIRRQYTMETEDGKAVYNTTTQKTIFSWENGAFRKTGDEETIEIEDADKVRF